MTVRDSQSTDRRLGSGFRVRMTVREGECTERCRLGSGFRVRMTGRDGESTERRGLGSWLG